MRYQKLTTQTVAHNTHAVSPATLSDRTMVSAAPNPYKVRRHMRYPKAHSEPPCKQQQMMMRLPWWRKSASLMIRFGGGKPKRRSCVA